MAHKYEKADEGFWINDNDDDLKPVWIPLPKPPPMTKIDGYGKAPLEQKFKHTEIPKKLLELQDNTKLWSPAEKWRHLLDNFDEYYEEYLFIEREWDRFFNGYWVFIKGKPYFLTGLNYYCLNYWIPDSIQMDFRDRDRRFWHAWDMCVKDPDSFGMVFPKHRREGLTSRAACILDHASITRRDSDCGIQSKTGDDAVKNVFKKYKNGWKNKPFWFTAAYGGHKNPRNTLENVITQQEQASPDGPRDMNTRIICYPASVMAVDGFRMYRYVADEVGKCLIKDTPVMMLDGSRKMSQDIQEGDLIMGPNGSKRTVSSIARGQEECFMIHPNKWDSWGCNKSHVLSLKVSTKKGILGVPKGGVLNISVEDYLELTPSQKKHLTLYKSIPKNTKDKSINRRNPMNSGFYVESIGVQDYYGFTLEEDPLFLLGDYTVTHNTTEVDVNERHEVVKQTMAIGSKIVGKALYGTTVEEMTKQGGANFKKLCDASHYHSDRPNLKRNKNNRTRSGLYLFFMPAHDGLEGFIDEWGFSKKKEAWDFLEAELQGFISAGDLEGFAAQRRKYPRKYRESFMMSGKGQNFDSKALMDRIEDLHPEGGGLENIVRGNLEWVDGVKDSKVEFIPAENGRFYHSWTPPDTWINQYQTLPKVGGGVYREPIHKARFAAGSDAYRFKETKAAKGRSKGGGAVFYRRNMGVDTKDIPIDKWQSHRFVSTYLHRPPTLDEYGEDMIKMCVYWGAMMDPENNIDFIEEYFVKRGYEGFLYYHVDLNTGKKLPKAGEYTHENVKEGIFKEWEIYLRKHIGREQHRRILQQCLEIEDDMGPFDLFVAGGRCLRLVWRENQIDQRLQERWSVHSRAGHKGSNVFHFTEI